MSNTDEKYLWCLERALKCKSKKEFHDRFKKAYRASKDNGWYDEVTSHMEKYVHPRKYTLDEVKEIAKKYKTKHDFIVSEPVIYGWCVRHGFLDEVTNGLESCGGFNKRCIYVYLFKNKVCYVGLTYNIHERHKQHISGNHYSAVYSYAQQNGIEIPEPEQITEYLDIKEAKKLENYYIKKYEKEGYFVLNRVSGGAVGGNIEKYSLDDCINEAKDCKTRKEFEDKNRYLYMKVKKHKWDDLVFSHMDKDVAKKIKGEKIRKAKIGKPLNIKDWKTFSERHSHFAVEKYSLSGNKLGEYVSAHDASRKNGCCNVNSIYQCCKGKQKTACGFVWRYKDKERRWKYEKKKPNYGSSKKVDKYSLDGEFLKTYNSIKEAAIDIGHEFSSNLISQCCKGIRESTCGFKWKYNEKIETENA